MNVSILFVLLILARSHYCTGVSDNPTPANFLRRGYHASIIVNQTLYIDGGDFSQLVDGALDDWRGDGVTINRPNNVTWSIDMSVSWTNTSVSIRTIPKPSQVPVLNQETLWPGLDGLSFYPWGGERSFIFTNVQPPSVQLWKFTANATGGSWSSITPPSKVFSNLKRALAGSGTVANKIAYYLGGAATQRSEPRLLGFSETYPLQGLTSFDFNSGLWANTSSLGLNTAGTNYNSRILPISAFGSDNRTILVVLGGLDPGDLPQNGFIPAWNSSTLLDFSNVTMYDPVNGIWLAQEATGQIPPARLEFCAVVVRGDNNTYEIIIHGGSRFTDNVGFDDIYILTIPGFVWFQAPYSFVLARTGHTCEVAAHRQMIVIGGIGPGGWTTEDPFAQGLGVFDLTDLEWMASYDASAAPYTTPSIVKSWYNNGGQSTVQWQSNQIARMFVQDGQNVKIGPTPQPVPNAQSTGSATNTSKTIGISIGVGLPVLIFIAVCAVVLYARQRHKKTRPTNIRVRNIPKQTTKDDLESLILSWFHKQPKVHSLAPESRTHNCATASFPSDFPVSAINEIIRNIPAKSNSCLYDVDFEGFTPLYDAGDNAIADIVAIVGLGTNAFGTFRSPDPKIDVMWPRDWLGDDIPNTRALLYGYNTKVDGNKSNKKIEDVADLMSQQLVDIRKNTETQSRPIIFLGQSLGGIIVQEALVRSQLERGPAEIFKNWYGLIGFGVPLAGLNNDGLRKAVEGRPNEELIKQICYSQNSQEPPEYLKGLKSRFDTCVQNLLKSRGSNDKGPELVYFWETHTSTSFRNPDQEIYMVPKEEPPGAVNLTMDTDHSGMVKYSNRGDQKYINVKNRIKSMVDNIGPRQDGVRGVLV